MLFCYSSASRKKGLRGNFYDFFCFERVHRKLSNDAKIILKFEVKLKLSANAKYSLKREILRKQPLISIISKLRLACLCALSTFLREADGVEVMQVTFSGGVWLGYII